jgi:hypothetical protein
MTEKELEQVKREARVSMVQMLAKAMGATVVFHDFATGVFTMQMDQASVAFFGDTSLVQALEAVRG